MKKVIRSLCFRFPFGIRWFLSDLFHRISDKKKVAYIAVEMMKKGEADIAGYGRFMKEEGVLRPLSGRWRKKYYRRGCPLYKDVENGLYYTFWRKKRLYFKEQMPRHKCQDYFASIQMEQDLESPHCYLTSAVKERLGGIVLDIGSAEGNFALDVIDCVENVYCFEPDREWIKALKYTLSPYEGKSQIVEKFVSDCTDKNTIRMDDFWEGNIPGNISCIKIDVEGYEPQVLEGMRQTLEANPQAVLLICVYHKLQEEEEIRRLLEPYHYNMEVRHGKMAYALVKGAGYPFVTNGVMECSKKMEG